MRRVEVYADYSHRLQDDTLSVVGNEIANRGEFPGGPDGCAIDFEDSSDGVSVIGNYISHSWGAGIMIFAGTGTGNTNLFLKNNILIDDGCKQRSADHGEIAFMRGGQNGTLDSNLFATCAGATVFQGDHSRFEMLNNTVNSSNVQPSPSPPPLPPLPNLKCPAGQHPDVVYYCPAGTGCDDGSCDCARFCAVDWFGSIHSMRPHWAGATTAVPGSKTDCWCVQATHFCPRSTGDCQAQCATGLPSPSNYCVPDAPSPPPAPAPISPTFYTVSTPVVTSANTDVSHPSDLITVRAHCATRGATLRYTLDGSRPLPSSPVFPQHGVIVRRATSVVVKAFAKGLVESAAAGGVFSAPP